MKIDTVRTIRYYACFLALLAGAAAGNEQTSSHWKYAPTPPMGWNSWDCFGTTLTEAQTKAQADAMAEHLKPYGWTY